MPVEVCFQPPVTRFPAGVTLTLAFTLQVLRPAFFRFQARLPESFLQPGPAAAYNTRLRSGSIDT